MTTGKLNVELREKLENIIFGFPSGGKNNENQGYSLKIENG